jgi:excisionase family DNA binding protein
MATDLLESSEPVAATEAEMPLARESSRRLARYTKQSTPLIVTPEGGKASDAVVLPASAVKLLVRLLSEMAAGNAVTLIPVHAELTTQQAAGLLGVSRPFVIKQIEDGKLPHRRIGTHRRVMFKDLMDFKRRIDADRSKALDQLAAEAQKLNLGY